jgi:hypothetical protein
MPATMHRTTAARADGLLVAPVGSHGRWAALRALRDGMNGLRRGGIAPHLSFIVALARDGRIVPGKDPDAALFVLGYRLI